MLACSHRAGDPKSACFRVSILGAQLCRGHQLHGAPLSSRVHNEHLLQGRPCKTASARARLLCAGSFSSFVMNRRFEAICKEMSLFLSAGCRGRRAPSCHRPPQPPAVSGSGWHWGLSTDLLPHSQRKRRWSTTPQKKSLSFVRVRGKGEVPFLPSVSLPGMRVRACPAPSLAPSVCLPVFALLGV